MNWPMIMREDLRHQPVRGNDLGISYKWYGFGVKRSKVKVRVNSNMSWFKLYEYLIAVSVTASRQVHYAYSPQAGELWHTSAIITTVFVGGRR